MSEMVKNKGTVKELYAGDGTIKDKLRNLAQELGIKEDELYYPIDENDNYVDWKGNYYRNYEAVGDRLFDVSGAPNQYDYEADGEEEVKKVSEGVYEIDFFYYNGGTSFGELFAENLDKADAEYQVQANNWQDASDVRVRITLKHEETGDVRYYEEKLTWLLQDDDGGVYGYEQAHDWVGREVYDDYDRGHEYTITKTEILT